MNQFIAFRTRHISEGQLFYYNGKLVATTVQATAQLRSEPFSFCTIFLDRVIDNAAFMIQTIRPYTLDQFFLLLTATQRLRIQTDNSIRLGSCREPTLRRNNAGK